MSEDVPVYLGMITLDLRLEGCTSLKDKRRIVKGMIDRVRSRIDVCVAEVGYQDVHARSIVCAASLSRDRGRVERALDQVRRIADGREGVELLDWWIEWR